MKRIPNIGIVVGYDCPKCKISGIRRKQKSCCKCGLVFDWNPYKSAEKISARRVKEIVLNTNFDGIQPEDGGGQSIIMLYLYL